MDILKIGGRRWKASKVFWGTVGNGNKIYMPGYFVGSTGKPTQQTLTDRTVNIAEVGALYALLHRAEPIYVGEAQKLGLRLRKHLSDDLAGLWDEFTWVSPTGYEVVQATNKGRLVPWNSQTAVPAATTEKQVVELLELVAVNFSKQGLNSQKPSLSVKWLIQGLADKAPKTTEQQIAEIFEKIKAM